MIKEPTVALLGIVKNYKRIYDKPNLNEERLKMFEGKRFRDIMEEVDEDKTPNQLAYYYGGIIAATCMKSESYAGCSKNEIDNYFQSKFLEYTTTKEIHGEVCRLIVRDRLSRLSKKALANFINNVIALLAEQKITVLSAYEYKYGKYILPPTNEEVNNDNW